MPTSPMKPLSQPVVMGTLVSPGETNDDSRKENNRVFVISCLAIAAISCFAMASATAFIDPFVSEVCVVLGITSIVALFISLLIFEPSKREEPTLSEDFIPPTSDNRHKQEEFFNERPLPRSPLTPVGGSKNNVEVTITFGQEPPAPKNNHEFPRQRSASQLRDFATFPVSQPHRKEIRPAPADNLEPPVQEFAPPPVVRTNTDPAVRPNNQSNSGGIRPAPAYNYEPPVQRFAPPPPVVRTNTDPAVRPVIQPRSSEIHAAPVTNVHRVNQSAQNSDDIPGRRPARQDDVPGRRPARQDDAPGRRPA